MTSLALTTNSRAYARRWHTLIVLSLSLVIIGLDTTVLNVALPTLQTHFHASSSTLEWMVDAYLLAFAGLLLLMGTIGDHFGRKRALQAGLVLFGGASALASLAQSAGELIALRAVMGVGGAMIMPATLSIISNVFPREERGKAISVWSAMAGVGIGLGPFIGGLLLAYFSWSAVFWLNVPIAAAALVAGAVLVPESRDPEAGAFDLVGASLSVAGLVSLVYGIIEAPTRGWTDPLIVGCFAAAAILGAVFVWWEARIDEPMLQLGFFRNRSFSVASLGIALDYFALQGAVFSLSLYLQFAHGFSALTAGAIMLPLAVGIVAGAGNSARLVARLGTTRVVALGLLGVAAILATGPAWTPTMAIPLVCLTFFGLSFFVGNVMAPATASVMGSVPEEKAGVGSAMNDVNRQVGGALGVAVIGSIISSVYSNHMSGKVSTLPASIGRAAKESIGAAHAIAAHLPSTRAHELVSTSNHAFTDALGIGFLAASLTAAIAAAIVARFLPNRPVVIGSDASEPVDRGQGRANVGEGRGGVVVVGGGFAGAYVARMLGRRGATIVSPDNFMTYTPLLPDAAAGSVEPRHVVMPIRQMAPHADLVLGTAVDLDESRRVVTVATDNGSLEVRYERLVFAPGAVSRVLPVPGLAERGVGFKSIADAVHLRNTILRRLDQADASPPERAERYLSFVFVGGGYAGVEAIGQLHDLARHALRYYPRLRDVPQRWVLVDGAPHLLSGVPGRLGEYAARTLTRAGIEIHSETHLVSAEGGHVVLSDGTELEAETLVWAAGVQASPLGARFGLPFDERGRVVVDETLRVENRDDVFALGDAAAVPNGATGALDPPTSQHALRQARRVAANLKALADGRAPRQYRYRTRGQMAILGRHRGIALIGRVPLTGLPAWLVARSYHLLRLPLRVRRFRVAADWAIALLFPWDISELGSLGHPEALRNESRTAPAAGLASEGKPA